MIVIKIFVRTFYLTPIIMDTEDLFAAFEDNAVLDVNSLKRTAEIEVDSPPMKKSRLVDAGLINTNEETVPDKEFDDAEFDADLPENFEVVLEKFENVGDNCMHECIRPKNWTRKALPDTPPAKEYKFKLDNFQQAAVNCLEQQESVLVSAHTSAGKTVVAEYAISMGLRDKQRVIYTSPIKALSNQKFRDLSEEFKDVGLLTGDVSLNPNASIMVMTTEILRSMLYRGSELCREVAWVIFDEIHYMRDRERGVVWEETLVLLPDTVRLVFLSATIPNSAEFAEWICRIKHQPCHLIYTDFRPTPLQHFVFPVGGESVFKVYDQKKSFYEDNFMRALACIQQASDQSMMTGKGTKSAASKKIAKNQSKSDVEKLLTLCQSKGYLPIIVFSFSKKDVESNATSLKKLDLNSPEEKKLVEDIFTKALDTLSEEDRKMPQIQSILPLLMRGIGMHHGGLLPIVKELIEILFQYSLIKVLFSTETFAMGVNMPAKTVIFTAVRKWDGEAFRLLNSGEFIQMSGRAGRRGLDDKGITIMMLDDKIEPDAAKEMFVGAANKIDSAFHLTYNMLLNLLRVQGADPEYMMRRSFRQHQKFREALTISERIGSINLSLKASEDIHTSIHQWRQFLLPSQLNSLTEKEIKENDALSTEESSGKSSCIPTSLDIYSDIADLHSLENSKTELLERMRQIIIQPKFLTPFLAPGRLVHVKLDDGRDFNWGIVTSSARKNMSCLDNEEGTARGTAVDVFLFLDGEMPSASDLSKKKSAAAQERDSEINAHTNSDGSTVVLKPMQNFRKGVFNELTSHVRVVPVALSAILDISAIRANFDINGEVQKSRDKMIIMGKNFMKVLEKVDFHPMRLDPIENMKIDDPHFLSLHKLFTENNLRIKNNPISVHCPPLIVNRLLAWQIRRSQWSSEKTGMESDVESHKFLVANDELRGMRRVLLRLNYVDRVNASTVANAVDDEKKNEDENNNKPIKSLSARSVVVSLKGRVACEITTSDELLAAELLFHNFFQDLSPEYCAALLSCLVCDERCNNQAPPSDAKLLRGFEVVQEVAKRIATVSLECKLPVVVEDYVDKFKPHLMDFVLGWCKGGKFGDLASKTDMFEGSIIRCLRRLEELLRQLAGAAKAIGNNDLEEKFTKAIGLIRRGIIFASSLYL